MWKNLDKLKKIENRFFCRVYTQQHNMPWGNCFCNLGLYKYSRIEFNRNRKQPYYYPQSILQEFLARVTPVIMLTW